MHSPRAGRLVLQGLVLQGLSSSIVGVRSRAVIIMIIARLRIPTMELVIIPHVRT